MSDTSLARSHSGLSASIAHIIEWMEAIPYWFTALMLRIPLAAVFWRSGQTKVDGWHLSASAVDLFRDEYKLPLIDPTLAAYLSAIAEHFFPALLFIGLATRFSALALLIMTLVIEFSSIQMPGQRTAPGLPASWC